MKMLITRKRLIKEFARKIASLQKSADYWFYINHNQDMSSQMLDRVMPLREMCIHLGICNQVYEEAYKLYDFRDSGKKEFQPDLKLLKETKGNIN